MLNIGIIGAGRIGKVHLQSVTRYVTDAKVIALADPFMNAETEEWARSLGVAKLTRDYKEILSDPEVDAVFICSSTDTHSAISLEAIAAGKHIFCEKPVDHDLGKIKAVMQALEGSNVKYQVGFNRRFDHNFAAAREAVAKGRIGELAVLKITSRDPGAPPVDYIKVSGGIFLDMTIEFFTPESTEKIAEAIRFIISHDAPYLIHCIEGKDRTGLMCAFIEALCGASIDEIISDYMKSFTDYYGVQPGTKQYETLSKTITDFFQTMNGRPFPWNSIGRATEAYAINTLGLSEDEIMLLRTKLTK